MEGICHLDSGVILKEPCVKALLFRQLGWRTRQEWIFINYGACSVRPAGMME